MDEPSWDRSWPAWTGWLGSTLSRLSDGDFLVLTAQRPPWPAATRRGLLWFSKRSGGEGEAYVQFLNVDGHLYAECSGTAAFGGPLELSHDVQDHLTRLGWQAPTKSDNTTNYLRWFPPEEAGATERAATLAIETLRDVFQATTTDDIAVTGES